MEYNPVSFVVSELFAIRCLQNIHKFTNKYIVRNSIEQKWEDLSKTEDANLTRLLAKQ